MISTTLVLAMVFLQSAAGGFPAVTAESGTIHVVWQDDSEGNHEIYYSRSTGGPFSKPLNISRNPGISDLPRVVAHGESVFVAWSDTSAGVYQILLAQSDDGGTTFGSPRALSDGSASTGPPDIAWQEGRLFVVWDEAENDGETRIVYWDSMESRRAIAGGSRGLVPSIAVRGQRVVIAWHTEVDYKQRVYASHSDDLGKSFSAPVLLSGDLERSVSPSVGIAPNGRSFTTWSDRTSGSPEIFLAGSDTDARRYSAPKIIASPGRESIFPVIQVMDDDEIAIAWVARNSIVIGRISAAGEPKQASHTLSISDDAGMPRLAIDGGRPIVVWKDWRAGQLQILISKDGEPGLPLL